MLTATALCRSFGGTRAVIDVDLHVEGGTIVGLLGPNGAGKTTTLRMLSGALAQTSGRVLVGGIDLDRDPIGAKRQLGFLPERPPLYDDLDVAGHLRLAARLYGVEDVGGAVQRGLARTNLEAVADRPATTLSKGFQQRVGLGMALVHEPAVLLLDEPTSGLDPAQRVALRSVLQAEAARGCAVLLSTHALGEITATCQRVVVLARGRVVLDQDLAQLGSDVVITVARPEGLAEVLRAVAGVRTVVEREGGAFWVRGDGDLRARVACAGVDHDLLRLDATDGLEATFLRAVAETA